MAAGQPKPTFYVALALVVLGLIAFAFYRSDIVAPKPVPPPGGGGVAGGGGGEPQAKIEPKDLGPQTAESTDSTTPTTVKDITFQASREAAGRQGNGRLQAAQGQHRTVRAERLGRLGTDRPGQQRVQGGARMEVGRRQAVQG